MSRLNECLNGTYENYIFPFFWQHGESEEVLREYMNAIFRSNIKAVCVESRPHPDFCGPKWWQDMDVILDEAKKLGMKVWILDDSHFPTGFANGAVKAAPEELTHLYMVKRTLRVSGPAAEMEFTLADYMKDAPLPPWLPQKPKPDREYSEDRLVKILACPVGAQESLGTPVDLTGCVEEDGIVRFSLGGGCWDIYVIRLTHNAEGRNDYINFLDKESCRLLIDAVYEPHYAHYKDDFGKTICGFFSDEPPIGNTPGYIPSGPIGSPDQNLAWSRAAADRMTEAFGSEDWLLYLPLLWADGTDPVLQAKMRSAYMNVVSRLVQECFSEQNGEWCSSHGVEYIGHALEDCDMNADMGPSLGHYFRGLAGQHMAGIDNIGGQVTIAGQDAMRHSQPACPDEAGFYTYLLAKLGVSHASIDPKKQGRCMCENLGAYGWQSGTKEQKYLLDHFMVRGVNRFVPHAFSAAPFPDPDCPPHFYAHGENPLYRAFGQLMAYTNRICHLTSGGKAVVDAALLYNGESRWADHKNADSNVPAARALTTGQVDFHVLPSDVFTSEYPSSFNGKLLTVNGVSYPALVISGCTFIEKSAADFIIKADLSHYPVIWLDHKASFVSGGSEEENTAFTAAVSNQICVPAAQAAEAVRRAVGAQITISPACSLITGYHYASSDGQNYYLFLNEDPEKAYEGALTLSSDFSGKQAMWYDPWENRLLPVQEVSVQSEQTVQDEKATQDIDNTPGEKASQDKDSTPGEKASQDKDSSQSEKASQDKDSTQSEKASQDKDSTQGEEITQDEKFSPVSSLEKQLSCRLTLQPLQLMILAVSGSECLEKLPAEDGTAKAAEKEGLADDGSAKTAEKSGLAEDGTAKPAEKSRLADVGSEKPVDKSGLAGIAEELTSFHVKKIAAHDYLTCKEGALAKADAVTVNAPFRGMQKANPYFSGYYIYECQINAPAGHCGEIGIANAGEAVEVFINDISLGMRLQPPYTFRIPSELAAEKNTLRIEVATTLERQVLGMGINIAGMSTPRPIAPTGLIGPVTIVFEQ